VLKALQIDKALLPECHESPAVSGTISEAAAAELGIPAGTPVVGGGGDQAASAVGNGIVKTGVVSATIGTSGVVFAFSDAVQTDPQGRAHTFCHAVPGKWHVMGVMLSAGGSLQWFRNHLGVIECDQARRVGVDPYEVLCEVAEEAAPGCEGLFFLPYLTGERTPHANPNARGAWVGLTTRHGKADLIRSLLEGVTFGMKDSLEIIKGMGIPVTQIRVSGGGARSRFWRQLQADIYGQPVFAVTGTEGAAFGVALLAGVGAGLFKSVEEACEATIKVGAEIPADTKTMMFYRRHYPIFQQLYRSLKKDFDTIAAAVTVA
jgi:xylulokinase